MTGSMTRGEFTLDLDVRVPARTTLAVVGPNGAGKTTLLRAIAGLVALDSGIVRVNGAVWDEPATHTWVPPEHRSVGFVFQDQVLFPHLSVTDNVAFGLRCRGMATREARDRAREWLERVGLSTRGDAAPAELSGGQAQRVALARALATEPDVLLLDEPLHALDAAVREEIVELLDQPLTHGHGVRLFVTHDSGDARHFGDRVLALSEGRHHPGPTDETRADAQANSRAEAL